MSSESRIQPAIHAARAKLSQGRERLRALHEAGALGMQVSQQLTQLFDELVLGLYQDALAQIWETNATSLVGQVALVAHGGYGRADVAPFSDIDLMLLHAAKSEEFVAPLVRKFTYSIFDTGMQLGFSVRTIAQASEMAKADATVFTALAESRLLHGEETLYKKYFDRMKRESMASATVAVNAMVEARDDERAKCGETVYLLEPNVKRSRGGLRDIQLLRWLGYTQHGETDLESLKQMGMLSTADWRRIRDAREFLLRLRNEMHFHAGKPQDVLDRAEQVRIAQRFGYQDQPGMLAVELFMRDYFHHTENVSEIASHTLLKLRPRSAVQRLVEPLLSHRVENDFRVGPTSIWATSGGLAKLRTGVAEVLRLMEFAALYDKPIDQETWDAVRESTQELSETDPPETLDAHVKTRFLELLNQPLRLAQSLRQLHRLRLLEQLIPAVRHTRCLLQFNSFHKYTVDEHTLRAVEIMTAFLQDKGPVGDAYRAVKQKRALHLAMILHDLGKGFEEDHSEVGKRIAQATAARLGLSPQETEIVVFLVHKHLRMDHIAQRHDIHDDRVVAPFAAEVGSPEVLRMLFVLTCADIAAVGPGVLNDWKVQLLNDLYKHTLHLFSESSPEEASDNRLRRQREAALAAAAKLPAKDWWERQIACLPPGILWAAEPQRIVEELAKLQDLPHREAVAWGRYLPERNAVEYTVGTYDEITPGIFYKLAGALSSNGQQILSAEIHTLADGLVLDRFYVEDRNFAGPTPLPRIDQLCAALVAALKDTSGKAPIFPRMWKSSEARSTGDLHRVPTYVAPDNETSDRYTIISVFTYDRMGLLYSIARTVFEARLSIARAKISTHKDQVVDVFYLTDADTQQKIQDPARLAQLRENLLVTLAELQE
jgi:[protein-PII] uridylyltransferase